MISGDMPSITPSSVRQPQASPGPADCTHGIARSAGLPAGVVGAGSGVLLDAKGETGRVSIR
ncbi:hypothetical protein LMTR3_33510 [Bradyrhizobium sp. LMTR 3]|nr:hypothetical protein LMTR3_33510 [Bradyrhizobium sp. LMTR 3]